MSSLRTVDPDLTEQFTYLEMKGYNSYRASDMTDLKYSVNSGQTKTYTIKTRQTDPSGNTSTTGIMTVRIDNAAPSVTGRNGVSDNEVYGYNQSFSLSGIKSGATGYYPTNNGSGWRLEDGAGTRTVYTKYRDEMGNEYEVSGDIECNPS